MKRKVLVSMGMCLMLFFSFATMTQAGYVNFDVTVAANGNHPDPLSPRMQKGGLRKPVLCYTNKF